ncbi:MAG: GNAT family N-acetyltransferase [Blastocatellia bacterium]
MTTHAPQILPPGVRIRNEVRPGDAGYLTYLHGVLYAGEYGFDRSFETHVAGPLAEFVKFHTPRERIWIVEYNGQIAGSIAIGEMSAEEGRVRWFILHPDVRGLGLGKYLMNEALAFCRVSGYARVFLWTVSALETAIHIYTASGFQLREQNTHEAWGTTVTEQQYDLTL